MNLVLVSLALLCNITCYMSVFSTAPVPQLVYKMIAATCFIAMALYNNRVPLVYRLSLLKHGKSKRDQRQRDKSGFGTVPFDHMTMVDQSGTVHNLYTRLVYGNMITLALLLSWIGDLMLALDYGSDPTALFGVRYFVIGGISFLVSHLTYMVAFVYNTVRRGREYRGSFGFVGKRRYMGYFLLSASLIAIISYAFSYRLLFPHISSDMLPLAYSYLFVISLMVMLSPAGEPLFLTKPHSSNIDDKETTKHEPKKRKVNKRRVNWHFVARVIGSLLFYMSDIFVARAKFVDQRDPWNRIIGLPLYFNAQLCIAMSLYVAY